ncbi:heparinase II/III family protein [Candidatus Sumerlaeota bacterium]|nr:heparinase II/III family protein [Candidatus Sumerlaeota bacterium]
MRIGRIACLSFVLLVSSAPVPGAQSDIPSTEPSSASIRSVLPLPAVSIDVDSLKREVERVADMDGAELVGLDPERRTRVENSIYNLALLYRSTGEKEYARRAVLLFDRLAGLSPSRADSMRTAASPTPRVPERHGERGMPPQPRAAHASGLARRPWVSPLLPLAYDLVRPGGEFEILSHERGYDAAGRIEKDLLLRMATLRMDAEAGVGRYEPLSSAERDAVDVLAVARIGRVLGDPRCIHWAFDRARDLMGRFHYDATLPGEVPGSRSSLSHDLALAIRCLKGYSDPPGTDLPPRRFENYGDDDFRADFPLLDLLERNPWLDINLPTGLFPLGETYGPATDAMDPRIADIGTSIALLGGAGHAVLRSGTGPNFLQANVNFSRTGDPGRHSDSLSLALFAFGREMLSDIGAVRGPLGDWVRSAVAHNTAIVDGVGDGRGTGDEPGRVEWIVSRAGYLSAICVRGPPRSGVAGAEMRRIVVLVEAEPDRPYLLDVLTVHGGQRHDYVLHGSATNDMRAEADIPLCAAPSPVFQTPWDVESDVRQGFATTAYSVTFRDADRSDLGVRIHAVGGDATSVTLCQVPSPRRTDHGRDSSSAGGRRMPRLSFRREGAAPLDSVFVNVIEPFAEGPWVESVESVGVKADDAALAVRVRMGAASHLIVLALGDPPGRIETDDGLVCDGRLGFVAERGGRIVRAILVGGREIAQGEFRLSSECEAWTGRIVSARDEPVDGAARGVFETATHLPPFGVSESGWIVVKHDPKVSHVYPIHRIEEAEGGSRIVLREPHGLSVVDRIVTRETYYPQRAFQRLSDFRIDAVVAFEDEGDAR